MNILYNLKKYRYLILAMIIIVVGGVSVYFINADRQADESFHTLQIKRIFRGDNRFVPELTNIPGYHYTLATMSKVTNPVIDYGKHPKTKVLRIFQAVLSLLLPVAIFLIVRELRQKKQLTLILVLVPIMFPLLFMVYTDILSLTLFLFAFLFHVKKRYDLAGFFILLDIVVRQDNVIWLGFLMILLVYDVYNKTKKVDKKFIQDILSQGLSYIVVFVIFLMFYSFNGGVAIGNKSAHPSMKLHVDNIYLFFATFTIIFLPIIIFKLKDIWRIFSKHWLLSIGIIIGGYFIFAHTFVVEHPYNHTTYNYIYNFATYYILENIFINILTYALIVLFVGYMLVQPFLYKKYILIIPFIILFLSFHWLVTFRYYFIPLVILLLVLHNDERPMKYQIAYSGLLSVVVFCCIFFTSNLLP